MSVPDRVLSRNLHKLSKLDMVRVADNRLTRDTPFWTALIGKEAIVVAVSGDGLIDVHFTDQSLVLPCEGVLPARFELVRSAAKNGFWKRLLFWKKP